MTESGGVTERSEPGRQSRMISLGEMTQDRLLPASLNQARWHSDHAGKVREGMVQRRENVTGVPFSSVTIHALS